MSARTYAALIAAVLVVLVLALHVGALDNPFDPCGLPGGLTCPIPTAY